MENLSRAEVVSPPMPRRKRAGRFWIRALLTFILLLAVLVGAWFLAIRPYLHNLAETQLDQALSTPENQILLTMSLVPSGLPLPASARTISTTEASMNSRLSQYDNDQVQNLQMTITPAGMNMSFTVYGQSNSIFALPILSNGQLQVTNVQVQGLMNLVMTSDELASALNANLQNFSSQMTHKVEKITLLEHEIDIQLA